ncbi:cytochrome-c peroxidase [Cellulophaga baltica]|uniref:cytochrome-c peroxidase n=1 Tax=Cellulophaga TaxID=104264 RepID=UPI001C066573|nr:MULTISPECIES: cytochrome c peroxidase [Cellulophaga]MBU2995221.1 cytochrome-c peroxidase [Cellulophaga baltica]MDO6766616.1 cytochrome c peroxidase [Cellulophaga sp. 1_MG-2023]
MDINLRLRKLLVLLIFSFLISCNDESDYVSIEGYTKTDQLLETKLLSLATDLDYFILPSNTDYINIPADPNNPITEAKVNLGKLLFNETGIGLASLSDSNKETYSCASCHHSAAGFQSGIQQGIGEGGMGFGVQGESRIANPLFVDSLDVQPIRSPTVLNVAYQKLMLWNGQFGATDANIGTEENWTEGTPKAINFLGFEGVEIQAIAGLSVHRMMLDKDFCDTNSYTTLFDDAFSNIDISERYSLETAGLAIAAYERTLLATNTNFQNWLKGDASAMTENEKEGAILFFGKAKCYECHTGPALNSEAFYGLGMNDLAGADVHGVIDDATKKGRGGFTNDANDYYKFKVPQLYNLADVKFFGHGGNFSTVREIIVYKNNAVRENDNVPTRSLSDKFVPLGLTEEEIDLMTVFIEKSLYDNNLKRYDPLSLPTGFCFPNADVTSKSDMNCD